MQEYKIGDYYDISNNEKSIVSKAEKNGCKDQYFHKENVKFIVLHIDYEAREMLVIAKKPTEQEITLQGKPGYDNGIEELDRICREITGREEARSLTKEDIEKTKYWEDKDNTKSKIIFGEDDDYYNWLASRCVFLDSGNASFRMFLVDSGSVYYYWLYNSSSSANGYSYAVRPVMTVKI